MLPVPLHSGRAAGRSFGSRSFKLQRVLGVRYWFAIGLGRRLRLVHGLRTTLFDVGVAEFCQSFVPVRVVPSPLHSRVFSPLFVSTVVRTVLFPFSRILFVS